MLGKNHIVAGLASSTILSISISTLSDQPSESSLGALAPVASKILGYMTSDGTIVFPKTDFSVSIPFIEGTPVIFFDVYAFAIISFFLFILGSLLPDIDSPNSMLGRYVHVNIQHHTWTHAIWGFLLLCFFGVYYRPLMWCALGVFLHLFWDSFSVGGNCWFYPFSKYIDYPGGAHVKKNHVLKIYRVGELSEDIIIVLLVGIAVFSVMSYTGVLSQIYNLMDDFIVK